MKTNASGNKPPTLLQIPYNQRDIALLYRIFIKRFMSTFQIWFCFFRHASLKTCQARLRKLRDEYGLLSSIERAYTRGSTRPPLLWTITELGGDLLIHECSVPRSLIRTKPLVQAENNLKIKHLLAITDCELVFTEAAERIGMKLETVDERESPTRLTKQKVMLEGPDGQQFRQPEPDQLLTFCWAERRSLFHLEVDRASEDIELNTFEKESIQGKVIQYILYESDAYRARYGTRPLRVLFVCTGGELRLRNMCRATEQVIRKLLDMPEKAPNPQKDPAAFQAYQHKYTQYIRLGRCFSFICFDDLHPDSVLTQPVWMVAGQENRQPMLKLPVANGIDHTSLEEQ